MLPTFEVKWYNYGKHEYAKSRSEELATLLKFYPPFEYFFLIFILLLELCRFSDNCFLSFINDNIWPWPFHGKVTTTGDDSKTKQNSCTLCHRVTTNLFFNFGLLVVATILNVLFKIDIFGIVHINDATNSTINNGSKIQDFQDLEHPVETWEVNCESTTQPFLCLLFTDGGIGAYFQLLLCYNQMMIIVCLCLDEGRSVMSKLFNSKVMQFLGRISMSLYLIHDPIIFYFQFIFNGKILGLHICLYLQFAFKTFSYLIQEFSREFGIGKMMLEHQKFQFGLCQSIL